MRRILIATAVEAEREAVQRGLDKAMRIGQGADNWARIDVVAVGVGPAGAAAGTTASMLALKAGGDHYDLVVSAGIGGGFAGRAEIGQLVIANEIVAADLGAETPDGFRSVDELGFGVSRINVDQAIAGRLFQLLQSDRLQPIVGPILTVSTVTGTAATAAELAARVPGAAAEAMEGYGVAIAAQKYGVPVLELRAISNMVGPRDREAWRIAEALAALEAASAIIRELLVY